MQPRERQLHLRLDARRARDPASRRLLGDVVQQRGLADARFTAQDLHRALARPYPLQLAVERVAFGAPASQHLVTPRARRSVHYVQILGAATRDSTGE